MKKFIKDNKLISTIIGFLVLWGIWTTCSIFLQDKSQALSAQQSKTITESIVGVQGDLDAVKGDIKDFKKDVKEEFGEIRNKIDGNHEKIINILMRVEKSSKSMEISSKSIEKKMHDK